MFLDDAISGNPPFPVNKALIFTAIVRRLNALFDVEKHFKAIRTVVHDLWVIRNYTVAKDCIAVKLEIQELLRYRHSCYLNFNCDLETSKI